MLSTTHSDTLSAASSTFTDSAHHAHDLHGLPRTAGALRVNTQDSAVLSGGWHPPDTTLLTPPALTDEEKRSRIHYLRVAKTGSSAALHYFGLTNCSRRVQVHTSHMDMQVAFPQRSLAVLREPCDRAASLPSHLLGTYVSPNGTASRYIEYYNHSLRLSNKTSLLQLAAFVATSGISRSRVLGRHNTVFFAQSRYIGPRTEAAQARVHRVGRVPVPTSGRQQLTGQCGTWCNGA